MSLTTFMTIVMATVGVGALAVVVADHIPAPPRIPDMQTQLDRPRPSGAVRDLPEVYVDTNPTPRRPPAHLLVLDETPRSIPRPEVTHG